MHGHQVIVSFVISLASLTAGAARYPCQSKFPPLEAVRLQITAEKSTYLVGEPLRLTQSLVNVSSRALDYKPDPFIFDLETELYYRRAWHRYRRFVTFFEARHRRKTQCVAVSNESFRRGEEVIESYWLVFDAGAADLLLRSPGTYFIQLRMRCHPGRRAPECDLASNVLRIEVVAPPAVERPALIAWKQPLTCALVQGEERGNGMRETESAAVRSMASFLDRFPRSIFSTYAREALERFFEYRAMNRQELSAEESAIQGRYLETRTPE
ncbi:MAG: hypothetical protein NDJ92_00230 [Thermoanaerobaculia bacterium]|nr:hypothetical protein [Thermoanaerobaculia bacterium]